MKLNPNYPELYVSLGALSIVKNKPEQAVGYLEKAIKLDSKHPVAYSNLAVAYAKLKKYSEADAAMQQAIDLGYDDPSALRKKIAEIKRGN
jgi:Flp pilus assembly protein TadD